MTSSIHEETRIDFVKTDDNFKVIPSFCDHPIKHERRMNITEEMVGAQLLAPRITCSQLTSYVISYQS